MAGNVGSRGKTANAARSRSASQKTGAEPRVLRDERLDADVNEFLEIVADAQRAVDRQLKALSRKHKLTPRGIYTLTLIHAGLDRPSLLVDYFGSLPSTITLEVDRLVDARLVSRKSDERDRRIVRLALTNKGNKFREDVMDVVNAMFIPKVNGISKAEFSTLIETLKKIVY